MEHPPPSEHQPPMRKKGYVHALRSAKSNIEKLHLVAGGDLSMANPRAALMATFMRLLIADIQSGQSPSLFEQYPKGTVAHDAEETAKMFIDAIIDAFIKRDGAVLRTLANLAEQNPKEPADKVRTFLACEFLPLFEVMVVGEQSFKKPFQKPMTRKKLRKFVFERTKVDVEERTLAKWCKELGVKVKRDDIGRPGK